MLDPVGEGIGIASCLPLQSSPAVSAFQGKQIWLQPPTTHLPYEKNDAPVPLTLSASKARLKPFPWRGGGWGSLDHALAPTFRKTQ